MSPANMARRRLPRWSDLTPLVSVGAPELSPTRRRLGNALVIEDLRTIGRRHCPRSVFDYVDGAAAAEISLGRSRSLFAALQFNPSVLRDVSQVDTGTSILGVRSEQAFAFAPTGFTRLIHHDGERAVARVAQRRGIQTGRRRSSAARSAAPCNCWVCAPLTSSGLIT